ncbi:MAG: ribosome-binding factor A [Candidatus Peregrinibacteria bacterium]
MSPSSKPSKRPLMIASVVRSVVAPFLRGCPPVCGIVSLTDVEVSSDLSYANCLVSALKEPGQAVEFLESRHSELQRGLAAALQAFRIPKVRFKIDPRTERGRRIDELLAQ